VDLLSGGLVFGGHGCGLDLRDGLPRRLRGLDGNDEIPGRGGDDFLVGAGRRHLDGGAASTAWGYSAWATAGVTST
jgi:Ca2+-binding RTX toxin-like protein